MLSTFSKVVVAGAGHGGVELAAALWQKGLAGSIDLVSDENALPYRRPPLSKEYIKRPGNPLLLRPANFYKEHDVTLWRGLQVESINRDARTVHLSDSSQLGYDHLILATGARNRKPPIAGIDHPDVIELRTLSDAARIVGSIDSWRRVAIIGGGFIGLEAAGLFSRMGIEITVIEAAPRLMARAVSPIVSAWFQDFHHANGVRIHMHAQVSAVEHHGGSAALTLTDGSSITADAVMLAAGVIPNSEIAVAAGLEVNNGIVVDSQLSTSDPAISAIGDCAVYPSAHFPGMVRLESVQNANDQARTLAARLMGEACTYDGLPWFWSIQDDARLQIAGLGQPGLSSVVRGNTAEGKFSVYLFDGEHLRAVESVNSPGDHMVARRLIAQRSELSVAMVADPTFELRSLIA